MIKLKLWENQIYKSGEALYIGGTSEAEAIRKLHLYCVKEAGYNITEEYIRNLEYKDSFPIKEFNKLSVMTFIYCVKLGFDIEEMGNLLYKVTHEMGLEEALALEIQHIKNIREGQK